MSEPTPPTDPNEWKRPSEAEAAPEQPPPAAPPKPFPRAAVFGGLVGATLGVLVVVALAIWGGAVGRVIVAAVGFSVAGAILPWTFVVATNDNSVGCLIGTLSAIGAVVGLVVGVFFGLGSDTLEWWAYAGSGAAAAVAGGVGGGMGADRLTKKG